MSNVAIVYWSGTGNTETMADFVAEGVEAKGGTAVSYTHLDVYKRQRQVSFFELLTQTGQLADATIGLFKNEYFLGFSYGILRAFAAAQIKAILLGNTKHLHRIVEQTLLAAEELVYRFDVFCVIEQIVPRFTNCFQQGGRLRALRKYGVNSGNALFDNGRTRIWVLTNAHILFAVQSSAVIFCLFKLGNNTLHQGIFIVGGNTLITEFADNVRSLLQQPVRCAYALLKRYLLGGFQAG